MRALSPATGKTAWKRTLAAPKYSTIVHDAESPVTVRAGVAYVNFSYSGDNYMALDVATGKIRWALYGTNDSSRPGRQQQPGLLRGLVHVGRPHPERQAGLAS